MTTLAVDPRSRPNRAGRRGAVSKADAHEVEFVAASHVVIAYPWTSWDCDVADLLHSVQRHEKQENV